MKKPTSLVGLLEARDSLQGLRSDLATKWNVLFCLEDPEDPEQVSRDMIEIEYQMTRLNFELKSLDHDIQDFKKGRYFVR